MHLVKYKNYSHWVSVKGVLRQFWSRLVLLSLFCRFIWVGMDQYVINELVMRLDESLEITSMEQGVKFVGAVLSKKPLDKWGVKNILSNLWREFGEAKINWVKGNTFIIIVKNEDSANQIIDFMPGRL